MKAVLGLMLSLVIAGGLTLVVSAQTPPPPPAAPFAQLPAPPTTWSFSSSSGNAWFQHMHMQSEAADLARKLAKADNEDEKARLRKKLTETLNQVFDEHMKQQEKELDDLERQISNLRKLMNKREKAKQTIVERRIEQLVQDADGLGWNAPNVPGVHLELTQPLQSRSASTPKATTPAKKKTERTKGKDRSESDDDDSDKDE